MTSTDVEIFEGADQKQKPRAKRNSRRSTPKPVPSRTNKRYDWTAIRLAYIEGISKDNGEKEWPTYAELADLYDVSAVARIGERAAAERWVDQRTAYQKQLHEERLKSRSKELAKHAVDLDTKALNVAKLGIAMVAKRLSDIAKLGKLDDVRLAVMQAHLEAGEPIPKDLTVDLVDSRELNTLAQAAQGYHTLGLRAMGEDVQRHEITGPDGGAIQVRDVSGALSLDDAERLVAVLNLVAQTHAQVTGEDIVEADVVEDDIVDQIDPDEDDEAEY